MSMEKNGMSLQISNGALSHRCCLESVRVLEKRDLTDRGSRTSGSPLIQSTYIFTVALAAAIASRIVTTRMSYAA